MRLCAKVFCLASVVAAGAGLGIAVAQQAVPSTQNAEPAKDPTKIVIPIERVPIDIRRTTIIVRDMETSLKLYRDGLGMRVNYDERMSVSSPAFAQGGPPRPIRLVLLNANDPWIGWIGLIQYTDRPDHPKVKQPKVLGPGSHIIVTAVADAQKTCDAAKLAPGVRMIVEPKVSVYPPRTPGTPPIRVLGCQFFDADGAYLELNQTLPQ
ncbi:VOC family protein [Aquidulcibacter sp.]|jgi:catechol 2,3-dioxygenase-like lactoylglutathione lyase family enzyme|uniref:VOC family protein n=1 Tax=Aquidulcibacter sp. TaxID=2052990 RepID=UPI0028AD2B35|nr:VOC family protein [Aquidulcibacter sp.]